MMTVEQLTLITVSEGIEFQEILIAALSAAVYSFIFYAKRKSSNPEEPFKPYKFLATMVVGIAVGISLQLSGLNFGSQSIFTKLTAYAGSIALVESLLKAIWRQFIKDYVSSER